MMRFDPKPNDTLQIGSSSFVVSPHPAIGTMAFAQEGRKAIVYQLRSGQRLYALKVFKSAYRTKQMEVVTGRLTAYAHLPGLEVVRREVITAKSHPALFAECSELQFAVLMPWIEGSTWFDIVYSRHELTADATLNLSRHLAYVLMSLENKGAAHCDVSNANVILNLTTGQAHLVDVEDMFGPGFPKPMGYPQGTGGYQHHAGRTSDKGQWRPEGDRFAGAILLAEMLAWHDARIRRAAFSDSYFDPTEMQDGTSERYYLIRQVLSGISPKVRQLFEEAWHSQTLVDCPTLKSWLEAITQALSATIDKALAAEPVTGVDSIFATFADPILSVTPRLWLDLPLILPDDALKDLTPPMIERNQPELPAS